MWSLWWVHVYIHVSCAFETERAVDSFGLVSTSLKYTLVVQLQGQDTAGRTMSKQETDAVSLVGVRIHAYVHLVRF